MFFELSTLEAPEYFQEYENIHNLKIQLQDNTLRFEVCRGLCKVLEHHINFFFL